MIRQYPRRTLLVVVLALAAVVGCTSSAPAPAPEDFAGIGTSLARRGISVGEVVSGDAGCADRDLAKTAISFKARGLDQERDVKVYLYRFRNRAAFERLRSTIDACARSYVTDPDGFESFEVSPYVAAGQGPWGPGFRDAFRSALTEAAGSGG